MPISALRTNDSWIFSWFEEARCALLTLRRGKAPKGSNAGITGARFGGRFRCGRAIPYWVTGP